MVPIISKRGTISRNFNVLEQPLQGLALDGLLK